MRQCYFNFARRQTVTDAFLVLSVFFGGDPKLTKQGVYGYYRASWSNYTLVVIWQTWLTLAPGQTSLKQVRVRV